MFRVSLRSYTSPDLYAAVALQSRRAVAESALWGGACVRDMDYSWSLCTLPGAAVIAVDWDHL